ncbi:hypothetical protein [Alkalimarinus alittae]|uniref:DUF3149 domain-containing protein n=1 Tax=Alkalimarinus alittae TaxID=2961619 RepID=A0ABY6MX62_9ALTE|nr:hypothetical protein [Alkalimarinus alittae]UZE94416.1 hypothetical protein NKI27_09940 [Alkalimarinus alittae]
MTRKRAENKANVLYRGEVMEPINPLYLMAGSFLILGVVFVVMWVIAAKHDAKIEQKKRGER